MCDEISHTQRSDQLYIHERRQRQSHLCRARFQNENILDSKQPTNAERQYRKHAFKRLYRSIKTEYGDG